MHEVFIQDEQPYQMYELALAVCNDVGTCCDIVYFGIEILELIAELYQ
jgi:hypothetical protein